MSILNMEDGNRHQRAHIGTIDVRDKRFGEYGGRYVPESFIGFLSELETAFLRESSDPTFWDEYRSHYNYLGRPSHIHLARRLTTHANGARIWLLREDLNHTGSYKIVNALGQVLLARRMGKKRIITETGAGQHGVATAAMCAKFGMECVVYIGAKDKSRQAGNVHKMTTMGASVVVVGTGGETLRDAVNEALRACVADDDGATYYLASAPTGPHPIPLVVRSFLAVIGEEARRRMLREAERLPEAVVTCIGAGSNATGIFSGFLHDPIVRLVGVEAAGDGLETTRHSAALSRGKRGVFHGGMTYVLQNEDGQIRRSHSIAAGMDYPGVAPELSFWKDRGRIEVTSATDGEALQSFELLSRLEGIIPSLESAHAVHRAVILARSIGDGADVLVCITGNGDKDVSMVNSKSWLYSKDS